MSQSQALPRRRTSSLDGSSIKTKIIDPLRHLIIPPGTYKIRKDIELKNGGYGIVTVVERGKQKLAVKQLNFTKAQINVDRFLKRFARELTVWETLEHPNLIKLSGFYLSPDLTVAQFYSPYYPKGNLRQYLATESPKHPERCRLAEDTAIALEYLHKKNIIHGDLKDLNVLLTNRERAVLCDYGLAKRIGQDRLPSGLTTSGNPITVKYASPELLGGERPNFTSDVWAWACLHMKILTDQDPYLEVPITAVHKRVLVDKELPADVQSLKLSPPLPKPLSSILKNMLSRSWDWETTGRPTMAQCVSMLKAYRSQQNIERSPSLLESESTSVSTDLTSSISLASSRRQSTNATSATPAPHELRTGRKKSEAKFVIRIRDFAYDSQDPRHKEDREVDLNLAQTSWPVTQKGGVVDVVPPTFPVTPGGSFGRITPPGSWPSKDEHSAKPSSQPTKPKERGLMARILSLVKGRHDLTNQVLQGQVYDEPMDISDETLPFISGVYRALYAFKPDRASEMELVAGQEVWCLHREGGDGWLLAVRSGYPKEIAYALVPEGYLKLDREFEGDEYSMAMHGQALHSANQRRATSGTTNPLLCTSPNVLSLND